MSLTGVTAWPGDPPSSLLEAPFSTASTPKTTKSTTKKRQDEKPRLSVSLCVLRIIGTLCLLHSAKPQKTKTNAHC